MGMVALAYILIEYDNMLAGIMVNLSLLPFQTMLQLFEILVFN